MLVAILHFKETGVGYGFTWHIFHNTAVRTETFMPVHIHAVV